MITVTLTGQRETLRLRRNRRCSSPSPPIQCPMEGRGGRGQLAPAAFLLNLVGEIVGMSPGNGCGTTFNDQDLVFRKDCTDLLRRLSLLTHFLEEIKDYKVESGPLDASNSSSSSSGNWYSDLVGALQAAKRLLSVAAAFKTTNNSDGATKKIAFRFQCVTWKLEKALANIPYEQFDISEEVYEQVALVRSQLQRATARYGLIDSRVISVDLSESMDKEVDQVQKENRLTRSGVIEKDASMSHEVTERMDAVSGSNGSKSHAADHIMSESNEVDERKKNNLASKNMEDFKKPDVPTLPDDFLCPISLELMRDPVIVATGQTYERSYIQRWIDTGNTTCPKTQQKLEHLTLTPNYVLRSLITQWCTKHNIEQPTGLANGRIKKSDGSFRDVSGDIAAIQALIRKLSSRSVEERKAAVSEIRSLSKRSTDNRILIAEAGAIPVLVNLLTADDVSIQENAVTAILNLSIYENNKGLIMLAGAIPSIVQILRAGSVEARENAAATLFSLSLGDENKIIIGASGAIPALVELLENGSPRGKKDAATALFNLCIYQGNKGRAVRSGIIPALLKMLTDSRNFMADEALTILSVLASNQDAKDAIVKASTIPVLIDLLRTGQPRNKENAAAILLSLCKRDPENLACISRLGAIIPMMELAKSGTERAKRKATSLAFTFEIYGDPTASSKDCFKMFNPVDLAAFNRVLNDWSAAFFTIFKLGPLQLDEVGSKASTANLDKWVSIDEYLDGYLMERRNRYGKKMEVLDLGMQEIRTYFRLFLLSSVLLFIMFCSRISKGKSGRPIVSAIAL